MRRRWIAAGAGWIVVSLALLTGVGYVDGIVPVDRMVEAAGSDYYLVGGFAILALLLAVPVLVSGRETELAQTEMPAPERPIRMPAPGDDFDDAVGRRSLAVPLVRRGARREIRERLRLAAIETVMRTENCDRGTARRMVDDGAWTTDPVAAAFVGRGAAARPSIVDRLAALGAGETWFRRRVRRTVAATAETHRHAQRRRHPRDDR